MKRSHLAVCAACVALGGASQAAEAPRLGIDAVRLEAGATVSGDDSVSLYALSARPYATWRPASGWELKGQVVLRAVGESGPQGSPSAEAADWGDTYVRYRQGDTRLTAGWQTIVWGRVDEIPVIDRASRVDARRLVLDPLAERRLAQPGLRWEQNWGDFKLDTFAFWPREGAALPAAGSLWHPVDQRSGEVLGVLLPPALSAFVQGARLQSQDPDGAAMALRLTQDDGSGLGWGLTVSRAPTALPYYRADPVAGTLTATYPRVNFAGADAELATDAATWRLEMGWSKDAPFTLSSGADVQREVVEWAAAVEFFPGGGDTRVNLQLAGRHVATAQDLLQPARYVALNGEIATSFAQATWAASLRFNVGLEKRDVYLAPRLAYRGLEPHEFYIGAHLFDGRPGTLGGFHRTHDIAVIGLKTVF